MRRVLVFVLRAHGELVPAPRLENAVIRFPQAYRITGTVRDASGKGMEARVRHRKKSARRWSEADGRRGAGGRSTRRPHPPLMLGPIGAGGGKIPA